MSKLEEEFSDETKKRILKLENDFEEFKVSIKEENLRLKVPYTTDRAGNKLGFSMPDASSKVLNVYVGEQLIGKVTLT